MGSGSSTRKKSEKKSKAIEQSKAVRQNKVVQKQSKDEVVVEGYQCHKDTTATSQAVTPIADGSHGDEEQKGSEKENDEGGPTPEAQQALKFMESFSAKPKYPMYVIKVSDLSSYGLTELLRHEDARREGLLKEVVEREGHPGNLFVYHVDREGVRGRPIEYDPEELSDDFEYETKEKVYNRANVLSVSHRWFRPSFDPNLAHPDGEDHRKFIALKAYLSEHHPDAFLWMDFFSIPQDPARRDLQEAAIKSLPNYFMYSSNTLVLCDTFESLVDQEKGYLSRGHCLLELVTTKLPRIDVFGKWYVPGFEKFGQWGKTVALEIKSGETRDIMWEHFASAGSPVNGNFTVADDCDLIRPLVEDYVKAFRLFHTHFMKPLLACESWEEVNNLPQKDNLPQIWNSHDFFSSPKSWCEFVLPEGYADMLESGQARQVYLKGDCDNSSTKRMEEIEMEIKNQVTDTKMKKKAQLREKMIEKKKKMMEMMEEEMNNAIIEVT